MLKTTTMIMKNRRKFVPGCSIWARVVSSFFSHHIGDCGSCIIVVIVNCHNRRHHSYLHHIYEDCCSGFLWEPINPWITSVFFEDLLPSLPQYIPYINLHVVFFTHSITFNCREPFEYLHPFSLGGRRSTRKKHPDSLLPVLPLISTSLKLKTVDKTSDTKTILFFKSE